MHLHAAADNAERKPFVNHTVLLCFLSAENQIHFSSGQGFAAGELAVVLDRMEMNGTIKTTKERHIPIPPLPHPPHP
jgi:hypothetical protein